jgi:hypothetical protein
MFYSSLLFHKEVNFTLKSYFNQLFSLPPNPLSNSTIITKISVFARISDHQEGVRRGFSSLKLGRPARQVRFRAWPEYAPSGRGDEVSWAGKRFWDRGLWP